MGSRGQNLHSGYLNRPQDSGPTQLPSLASSGGVAGNSAQKRNSGINSGGGNSYKAPSLYKYSGLGSGIGGSVMGSGIGSSGTGPYGLPNY